MSVTVTGRVGWCCSRRDCHTHGNYNLPATADILPLITCHFTLKFDSYFRDRSSRADRETGTSSLINPEVLSFPISSCISGLYSYIYISIYLYRPISYDVGNSDGRKYCDLCLYEYSESKKTRLVSLPASVRIGRVVFGAGRS